MGAANRPRKREKNGAFMKKKGIVAEKKEPYRLLINTVFEKLTITLFKGRRVEFHCEYFEKKRNAFKIDRIIESAFNVCDINFNDIGAIMAFTGPGSFTGIKLGLSVSYAMLCGSVNIVEKSGISMLDYLAFDAFSRIKKTKTAAVIVPGVRGEYFCRMIKNVKCNIKSSFASAAAETVVSSKTLACVVKPDYIVVEECAGSFFEDKELEEYRDDKLIVVSVRPRALEAFIEYCETADRNRLLELEPIYLKDTYALKPESVKV